MTDVDDLVVTRAGSVLIARLNRPDARNTLTPAMVHGIGAAILAGENDPDVRVVVLTGTGDRAFCAGMDLRAFGAGKYSGSQSEETRAFQRLLQGEVQVPLVGAAQATAVAGGLELLLACDIIVLAEGARLGLPEVKRGLLAAGGGTFLGTRIPLAIALEITLTGEQIDAARAAAIGLVNAVVPAEQVVDVALGYANSIAANGPLAVQATRELVHLGVQDRAAARARLAELQPIIFQSEDAKEGALAYVEKREPAWKGR